MQYARPQGDNGCCLGNGGASLVGYKLPMSQYITSQTGQILPMCIFRCDTHDSHVFLELNKVIDLALKP